MKDLFSRLLLIAMPVLLAGCSLLPAGRSVTIADNEPTPTPLPTSAVVAPPTYEVQRGDVIQEMNFNGRITPVRQEDLFFRTNGRVRAVFVERNTPVEAGQLIAELEMGDLEQEREARQLQLERAEARLQNARQSLTYDRQVAQINLEIAQLRLQQLQEAEGEESAAVAIQQKQVDLAQIALDRLGEEVDPLLVNDVAQAELALQRLDDAIADAQIVAPFDGLLRSHSLTPGREVQAFNPVAVVADPAELEVSASLLSSQLQTLSEGMPVSVVLPNRPSDPVSGFIEMLPYPYGSGAAATAGSQDDSVRIAIAEELSPETYDLGDLVQVHVVLDHREDVLWLPPQAIRTFDGRRFVLVREGEGEQRVDVRLGLQTFDRAEIVEGLSENQVVVGQ